MVVDRKGRDLGSLYAALLDTKQLVEFGGHHRIVVYYLSSKMLRPKV